MNSSFSLFYSLRYIAVGFSRACSGFVAQYIATRPFFSNRQYIAVGFSTSGVRLCRTSTVLYCTEGIAVLFSYDPSLFFSNRQYIAVGYPRPALFVQSVLYNIKVEIAVQYSTVYSPFSDFLIFLPLPVCLSTVLN